MLLLVICLLPLVTSASLDLRGVKEEDIYVDIHDGYLQDVRFKYSNHTELDLSNLSLRGIKEYAFDHVQDVESLKLDNNSLTILPHYVFSHLKKLKYLSLSHNHISSVKNLFIGLKNLQVLDISHNYIQTFKRGHFYNLSKSVKIIVDGNSLLQSIDTRVFATPITREEKLKGEVAKAQENFKKSKLEVKRVNNAERDAVKPFLKSRKISELFSVELVKLCKSHGIVTLLALEKDLPESAQGCYYVNVNGIRINLRRQDIYGFQKNWYQLHLLPSYYLDLSLNKITEITEETLNDLPASVTHVDFEYNHIHKIRSHVIKNHYLRQVNFGNNLIDEIEENAFGETNIEELYLHHNQLDNLNFVSSLPNILIAFVANGNHIKSIPDGVFSRFPDLQSLHLINNKIEKLQSGVFQGLETLQSLFLTNNSIATIERSSFEGLTSLVTLHLDHNSIHNLQNDTFAELSTLSILNLDYNQIVEAEFAELPPTVDFLFVEYNKIQVLEKGTFVHSPRACLSLDGNQISSIKHGAFNVPHLQSLYLNKNQLTGIDGDSYESLDNLTHIYLQDNKISEIHKGAFKHLGNLKILDVSLNPFQKLENGGFYGLNAQFGTKVYVYENNLKVIEGGAFDDIE